MGRARPGRSSDFRPARVEEDGVTYEWEEYLLFNPYKGFRYLTNYHGPLELRHAGGVAARRAAPSGRVRQSIFEGLIYKHFSGAQATTTFVLGEFPWRVKVGEEVLADDFVDPPFVLSSETTNDEVTWSKGEYTHGADIWKAFALPGSAPRPVGVYLNQPSPYTGKVGGTWGIFGLMLIALLFVAIVFGSLSRGDTVFDEHYHYSTADKGEPSFVTKVFDIEGRTSNLELTIHTNLINNWAYFNLALINESTGDAFDFGREVSYYTGSDSDGAWSEGGQESKATIPHVPAGRYYLRVEPEMEGSETPAEKPSPATATTKQPTRFTAKPAHNVYYEIVLRHDVAGYGWFWLAALLLLIPPIWVHHPRGRFRNPSLADQRLSAHLWRRRLTNALCWLPDLQYGDAHRRHLGRISRLAPCPASTRRRLRPRRCAIIPALTVRTMLFIHATSEESDV